MIPVRKDAGPSSASGSSGDNSFIGPEQSADFEQGVAPGGVELGNDLPVRAITGPHPFSEGFAPNNENPALPDPWNVNEGVGRPPGSGRR